MRCVDFDELFSYSLNNAKMKATNVKILKISDVVETNRLEDGSRGASYCKCIIQLPNGKQGSARIYQTTIDKVELAGEDVLKYDKFEARAESIGDAGNLSVTVYAPMSTWSADDFLDDDDSDDEAVESAEPVAADFDEE